MPTKVCAEALGMDVQTVRLLCQNGLVDWGRAIRLPGSHSYTYLISPKLFFEQTGYLWKEGLVDESTEAE